MEGERREPVGWLAALQGAQGRPAGRPGRAEEQLVLQLLRQRESPGTVEERAAPDGIYHTVIIFPDKATHLYFCTFVLYLVSI